MSVEYEVDERDEHGLPAVIAAYPKRRTNYLKLSDDRKMSKKRLQERIFLKIKDQQRLGHLYNLPKNLESTQRRRQTKETELKNAVETVRKEEQRKKNMKDDNLVEKLINKELAIRGLGHLNRGYTEEQDEWIKKVLLVPRAYENLRTARRECTQNALEEEVGRLKTEQEEQEEKERNQEAVSTPLSPNEPQPSQTFFQDKRAMMIPPQSSTMINISLILSIIFFLMAMIPSFRSFVVREFIVNFLIGAVAPPLLQGARVVGEMFSERLPLASFLIVSLYNVFGFWVLAGGITWVAWNLWIAARVVQLSSKALTRRAADSLATALNRGVGIFWKKK